MYVLVTLLITVSQVVIFDFSDRKHLMSGLILPVMLLTRLVLLKRSPISMITQQRKMEAFTTLNGICD
jgi:hypothetical protein